jgi:hypothetical protein
MYIPKSMFVKKYFFLLTLSYALSNAQVGIGTTSPNAQLDIVSTTNGVLIPRVALTSKAVGAPVVNPNGGGAPADATLVYNTATAGAGADAVAPGFYYYNSASSRWIQLSTALALTDSATNTISGTEIRRTALTGDITAAANSNATTITDNAVTNAKIADNAVNTAELVNDAVNSTKIIDNTIVNADLTNGTGGIYKGSGTLPSDVVVSMPDAAGINFNSTELGKPNHFRVDGATLSVDTKDRRVGIGTTAPNYKLHVIGDSNIKGELRFESLATGEYVGFIIGGTEGGDSTSFIIQSARGGIGAGIVFKTNNGSSVIEAARITNVGRFGLGVASPQYKFDMVGDANFLGDVYVKGKLRLESADGNDAGYLSTSGEPAGDNKIVIQSGRGSGGIIFKTNPGSGVTEAARFTNLGRFALGVTTATAQLHTSGTVRLETLTGTGNRMVITDANGNLAAQDIAFSNTDLSLGAGGIYKGSGTTPASAVVASIPTGGTLAFTPSGTQVANQFSVDGTTFSVDALNNRVGVGIAAPTSTLHNNGTTAFTTSTSGITTTVAFRTGGETFATPAANTCPGRVYIIRNIDTGATASDNVTVNNVIPFNSITSGNFTLTPAIGTIAIVSDGANWYRIN